MNKTFIMKFDYIEGCEKIVEAYNVDPEDLKILVNEITESRPHDLSALVVEFLESGKITGSEIMALATIALLRCVTSETKPKSPFDDIMKRFFLEGK